MKRALSSLMGILLLSSCAAEVTVPPSPVITVASGGFFGSFSTQIFADGTVIGINATPGKPADRRVQHLSPEVYTRAAAVLAREGAATQRALKPQAEQCLDYGMDQVSASPAVAGFDQVSAACPDAALSALMDHVLAALPPP